MTQAVNYDAILGAANTLRQITNDSYAPSNQIEPLRVTAGLDASGHTVTQADPISRLTTTDLAQYLAVLPPTGGLYLAADTIIVPRQLRASGGTFASGANHETLSATKAFIVPMTVSAAQGDKAATADLEVHFLSSDGLVAPVTNNVGQSLAAQAFTGEYLLGIAKLNGSQIAGVTGVTINYGVSVIPVRTDGAIYAHDFHVIQRDPSFDLRFVSTAAFNAVGPLFAEATSAQVFLRKKLSGSTVVADASLVHCSFTFGAGLSEPQTLSGAGNQSKEVSVRVFGRTMTTASNAAIA